MAACKLRKGDRIYECRYFEATLVELLTDPQLRVQRDGSHYWHWRARVVETGSGNVVPGDIVDYGISEESPAYGPRLFRRNVYQVVYDHAEPLLPPFDIGVEGVLSIRQYGISDDVEILGHVFHGLQDIMDHVEMSLYRSYDRGKPRQSEPKAAGDVHVGELWVPYPCFDSSDFASEDRTYQNFILRAAPVTDDDMRRLSELPSRGNECRISGTIPADILPIVYYDGDGDTMLVAI